MKQKLLHEKINKIKLILIVISSVALIAEVLIMTLLYKTVPIGSVLIHIGLVAAVLVFPLFIIVNLFVSPNNIPTNREKIQEDFVLPNYFKRSDESGEIKKIVYDILRNKADEYKNIDLTTIDLKKKTINTMIEKLENPGFQYLIYGKVLADMNFYENPHYSIVYNATDVILSEEFVYSRIVK